MGRRSDHSRDEIRDMALAAAQVLLEREGPEAVTTRAIAKAIGPLVNIALLLLFAIIIFVCVFMCMGVDQHLQFVRSVTSFHHG